MKKVLSLLKPHSKPLVLSIIFATLNTVMQLLIPFYTRNIMSDGILARDMKKLIELCFMMLGFTILGIITSIANTYFSTRTSVGYAVTLRNYIFEKVSRLSQSDIDKIGVASLVTRTTNDVRQVHDIVLSTLKSLIPVPIMLIGGLALAFYMNARLAKLSLLCIPVLAALAGILMAVIVPMFSKIQKLVDRLNQTMREKISGIRVVRAFNKTEYEDERFAATNKKLTGLSLRANRIMAGILPFISMFLYALLCVVIIISVSDANNLDPVTQSEQILDAIPNMFAFISFFTLVITAITSVVGIVVTIPKASISGKRIKVIMDAVSDIVEPENPITPKEDDRGKVEFRNVTFKYKPAPAEKKKQKLKSKKKGAQKSPEEQQNKEKTTFSLNDVSFTSNPGEITAIIGVTGSGKTTLINLIPRLYDAVRGEVLVAGVNVKDLKAEELEKRIAVIPQQAFLFSGTIADNIRFGKEDATDSEIWRALEIAQAKSFVNAMPDGIESFVSQAGKNFSGGQKQRLAIARAIVKGAEICIFDDSFSALDLATDARLRAALKENLTDTNLIIVAQRVGTVMNADRIIVLDSGNVVGQGTHKELLSSCQIYRDIVVTQLSEEALEGVNIDE